MLQECQWPFAGCCDGLMVALSSTEHDMRAYNAVFTQGCRPSECRKKWMLPEHNTKHPLSLHVSKQYFEMCAQPSEPLNIHLPPKLTAL